MRKHWHDKKFGIVRNVLFKNLIILWISNYFTQLFLQHLKLIRLPNIFIVQPRIKTGTPETDIYLKATGASLL